MLTFQIRAYDPITNTYVPYSGVANIGLWFKLTTDDCVGTGFYPVEHIYCVYDPLIEHNQFDLGFRKFINTIELTHYEIFGTIKVVLQD